MPNWKLLRALRQGTRPVLSRAKRYTIRDTRYAFCAAALILLALALWAAPALALTLPNPLGTEGAQGPYGLLIRVVRVLYSLAGACALIIFVVSGIRMMAAQGNQEKFTQARNALLYAVIGLFVIFGSYAFLSIVFKTLQSSGISG